MVHSVLREAALEQAGSPHKLTYSDFLLFPEDGLRHELIDGRHYVPPSPTQRHQRILGNLYYFIRHHLEHHPGGEVFLSPLDMVLSDHDVVVPDLLFVSKERAHVITKQNLQGAADLVIEILSPSTRRRDRGLKRALYERVNVKEYWLVDPDADVMEVFSRSAEGFHSLLRQARGQILTTPLLPGLAIEIDRVFDTPK